MAELSNDLKKIETVGGAFEILKYLYVKQGNAADGDDIMDDLELSTRRFDKAKRRLVTRNYIQMRSDYIYELTRKGVESAELLLEVEKTNGDDSVDTLQRQLALVLPRNFVYGTTSPLKIGIEPNTSFMGEANLIVRITPVNAELGDYNEMATLSSDALILETTITPSAYDKARIKVEVYQMQDDDFAELGGMYVDVVIIDEGDTGTEFAYTTDLSFA
ncbi:MAG: hypothetical protein Phog2KO_09590 [Phototrophicaceae bacterium]